MIKIFFNSYLFIFCLFCDYCTQVNTNGNTGTLERPWKFCLTSFCKYIVFV